MSRPDIVTLIVACFRDTLLPSQNVDAVHEATVLFGRNGTFDSMQLVDLLMDVEQRVNESCGTSITIADDRAMSQKASPFRTIGTLADYVTLLVSEQKRDA